MGSWLPEVGTAGVCEHVGSKSKQGTELGSSQARERGLDAVGMKQP